MYVHRIPNHIGPSDKAKFEETMKKIHQLFHADALTAKQDESMYVYVYVCVCMCHSLTDSLTSSLTDSLTHSISDSLTRALTDSLTGSLTLLVG